MSLNAMGVLDYTGKLKQDEVLSLDYLFIYLCRYFSNTSMEEKFIN